MFCSFADEAERCDRAAIECLSNASYDSALRGLAPSSCLAANLTWQTGGGSGDLYVINASTPQNLAGPHSSFVFQTSCLTSL